MLTLVRFDKIANRAKWNIYLCSCGVEKSIKQSYVKNNHTKSCGCLAKTTRFATTHNMSMTREYKIWISVRRRCNSINNISYADYGGRGITVCERWQNSFENFIEDMGNAPTDKHQIDRIDNNGNYSPENCRWVTSRENAQNTRRNVNITIGNETKCITEWCRVCGVSMNVFKHRMKRDGMSPEEALRKASIPRTNISHNGESRSRAAWCEIQGISTNTVCRRINKYGWSELEALELIPISEENAKSPNARSRTLKLKQQSVITDGN